MNDIKYGRKRSGIKKQLDEVISEWLSSIDDGNVRKLAKRDVIVTGGSICSMLLGEQVNDYDIYFKDMNTTIAVAKYYMNKIFDDVGETHGEYPCNNCVHVYKSENIKGEIEKRVACHIVSDWQYIEKRQNDEKYRVSFISSNAITLTDKIQIIVRFFGTPEEIHSNYDFAHAKCYYDYDNGNLVLNPHAMECMLSRTLIYEGSLYPIASIFRMKKFIKRGWRISAGQQLKIMWQISEINLTDPKILKEQLMGVDMLYLNDIIEALSKNDSNNIDSTYASNIIDRVFNETNSWE